MQDVDRPGNVEALPLPPRRRGVRVQNQPLRVVPRSEDLDGIAGYLGGRRDFGQSPAVGAAKPKLTVRLSIELVPLLVDRTVVAATEHGEVRERGGTPVGPGAI